MMKNETRLVLLTSLIVIGISATVLVKLQKSKNVFMNHTISSVKDVFNLFPQTASDIQHRKDAIIKSTKQAIDAIVKIPSKDKDFENTMRVLDSAFANFGRELAVLEVINNVNSDQILRDAAQQAIIGLQKFYVDTISQNVDLYQAIKDYAVHTMPHEKRNEVEKYFVSETLKDFERNGVGLPEEKRAIITKLKKDIAELSVEFDKNINTDDSSIQVSKEELAGLDEDFINSLKKADDKYILGVDYPTYFQVMDQCDVSSTREQLYHAFVNRAYPANIEILEKIIEKRDELAKELGFSSYAALDIDPQMAKNDTRVKQFLNDLLKKVDQKQEQEFNLLIQDLPSSVELVNNKLNPWDKSYIRNYYKKQHFNVDESKIAEYFPMEHTIQALLDIYKQFFSLEFKDIPVENAWDKEVRLLEVWRNYNNQKDLHGYLFLDLYPRPNKFTHACEMSVIPVVNKDSNIHPGVAVVLANFPKSTSDKPSLLKRKDVTTFFHEFGHALHELLGATELASCSGTRVKVDFVEMPSQMLEEWLFDKEILKMVSHHYKTGDSLPDDLIDTIITIKNFSIGDHLQQQILYSLLSLGYYELGSHKDSTKLLRDLQKQIRVHDIIDEKDHMQASFGHLTGYASKYYSYLWSKVFALDLFDTIKKHGLLNPEIGDLYVQKVIGMGGSKDPNELLYEFLGRDPNQKAFLRDLGLEE